jgi:hypothetical protein
LTIGVVGVLAVSGGWALAATSSSSGVIHACAAKHGGGLRLAGNCKHNERPVSWNVQGIPGRNGTNGINGNNGTNGTNGTNGAPGPAGPSFGDSAFFNSVTAGLCTLVTVAKLPITVTTPSRIFASTSGDYFLNGGMATEGEFEVELRDAGDTVTVAVLPTYNLIISTSNVFDVPFASDGVLRSGTDPNAPGATAYVVQPGSYLLKWLAGGFGTCDHAPGLSNGSLTYFLLGTSP